MNESKERKEREERRRESQQQMVETFMSDSYNLIPLLKSTLPQGRNHTIVSQASIQLRNQTKETIESNK